MFRYAQHDTVATVIRIGSKPQARLQSEGAPIGRLHHHDRGEHHREFLRGGSFSTRGEQPPVNGNSGPQDHLGARRLRGKQTPEEEVIT